MRKSEYARLTGKDRQFIKGQKYTLLSNHAHLTLDGRRSLAKLLRANQRLNIAYLLKESFGQLPPDALAAVLTGRLITPEIATVLELRAGF